MGSSTSPQGLSHPYRKMVVYFLSTRWTRDYVTLLGLVHEMQYWNFFTDNTRIIMATIFGKNLSKFKFRAMFFFSNFFSVTIQNLFLTKPTLIRS